MTCKSVSLVMIAVFALACTLQAAEIAVREEPGKVFVEVDGKPLATYHYRDGKILRPFFTDIHAPNGVAVTRNFPPTEGVDRTDHADMHPGLWLAFGRLGGADFWRNRARVEHVRFVSEPVADGNRAGFTVLNRYVTGGKIICEETCRVDIEMRPSGYFLIHDSVFRSDRADFAFGDQQEMGLGVRVATPLVVKEGGRMLDSRGRRDEKEIWGQHADWCDYSGTVGDARVGVTLIPDPANFRRSRFHARDYGALVANPFGRKDFNRGEESRVDVRKGESFRLAFAVFVHAAPTDRPVDLEASYQECLQVLARSRAAKTILQPGSRVEKVAQGCEFTEGPAFGPNGRLVFSDQPNDRILELSPDGAMTVWRKPCGRTNGTVFDARGRLLTCQSSGDGGGRRVVRIEKDGSETILAARYNGAPFIAPNDLCVDSKGRIFFTDPWYGPPNEKSQPTSGVYRIDAPGEVQLLLKDLQRPNGILLWRDTTLYVSDRGTQKLHRFAVAPDGGLSRRDIVHDFSPDRGVDGMCLDVYGNIYCAAGKDATTGLFVLSPDGELLLHKPMPEFSTNVTFGGSDGRDLFLTASTSVYRLRTVHPGIVWPAKVYAEL